MSYEWMDFQPEVRATVSGYGHLLKSLDQRTCELAGRCKWLEF